MRCCEALLCFERMGVISEKEEGANLSYYC